MTRLKVDLNGIQLNNPVMTASGTFGYAGEYKDLVDLNALGAIIVKGLSLYPSEGNPAPRVVETPSGLLNAVGLENVGIDNFIAQKLPFLKTLSPPVFTNIYGKSMEEYEQLARIIDGLEGISGIEVNISCPNVSAGGAAFGVDAQAAFKVVEKVRKATEKFVMVKLSPNVTDITEIALAVEQAGADAVSLINTVTGMVIDTKTFKPVLANRTGGLSGPCIKPIAVRMVWEVARTVNIPVIGIGGIMTARDAVEFILAGAWAVQVGTAVLADPDVLMQIITGLKVFMRKKGITDLSEIRGAAFP
ncbi:MAG: dihydroorotate dehydrogenase [Desulfobacteraceae bacterium]